jgi:hypothetical protein
MGVSVPVHACPILSSPRKPSIRSASVTAGVIGGVTAGDCHGPALDQPIMLPHTPLLAQQHASSGAAEQRLLEPVLVSW